MNVLRDLQSWYLSQCDGDWEHQQGIEVGTLDNPGWSLTVDLEETVLSGKAFQTHAYGVGAEAATSGNDWIHCEVKDNKFEGRGGPEKLEEMISAFLAWTKKAA